MTNFNHEAEDKIRRSLESAGRLTWLHLTLVGLSFCLTLFAWVYFRQLENAQLTMQFDRRFDSIVERVKERMQKYEDALWASVAFIGTRQDGVDFESWDRYATAIHIDEKYPGINGIGVIFALNADQVPEFVKQQRTRRPDFTIHPKHQDTENWPIAYVIPVVGNEQAVGLDMAHESNRITAARESRDTGTAQVTGPIVLVQDEQQTPGFLIFAPFYRPGPLNSVEDRRQKFIGDVYSPFVFSKLMQGTLGKQNRQLLVKVSDKSDVLFDEHSDSDMTEDGRYLTKRTAVIPMCGRTWTFDIRAGESFGDGYGTSQPLTILFAGLVFTGLLSLLFVANARSARQSLGLADQITHDLEKLGLAAKANKIGIWDYNPVSGELEWDNSMFELYGLRPNDFSAAYEAWEQTLHPEDLDSSAAALQSALQGESEFDCDFRIIQPDGTVRDISAKATVFRDSAGKAVRMLGANSDITDRKNASRELEEVRRLSDAIQNAAGVAIITTNLDGIVVMFNRAAEEMLGYKSSEMLQKQTPAVFHDPVEIQQRAEELSLELGRPVETGFEAFVAKARLGESDQNEWTYVRKDGSRFPVLLTVTALYDQNEEVKGFIGIAADITDRKEAQLELQKVNASLASSNQELRQFAYIASHDLKAPLRAISSLAGFVLEDCEGVIPEESQRNLQLMQGRIGRMGQLLQDLLAYSRAGIVEGAMKIVATSTVIQDAIDVSGVPDSTTITVEGEQTMINTFEVPLQTCLRNLISNAIKHCASDSAKIEIQISETDAFVEFCVADNGPGIPTDHHQRIFNMFQTLQSRDELEGSGMGLAFVKKIVDTFGGAISVESPNAMGGTTFTLSWPKEPTV